MIDLKSLRERAKYGYGAQAKEVIELLDQLEAAQKDAARYEHLLSLAWFQEEADFRLSLKETQTVAGFKIEADKAIDAAMTNT